jgi:hypothetical protein
MVLVRMVLEGVPPAGLRKQKNLKKILQILEDK